MARPQKQGMEYFPHDTDASKDDRIEALESQAGLEGYAIYFKLLERIYRTENAELDLSGTKNIIARSLHCRLEKLEKVLLICTEVGLFSKEVYISSNLLTSDSIKRRATAVTLERNRMRLKRACLSPTNIRTNSQQTTQQTTEQTGERKEKKRKVKEIYKEKSSKTFEKYVEELRGRFKDLDFDIEMEKFHLYWYEGSVKPPKNDKLALLNWMNKARREAQVEDNSRYKKNEPERRKPWTGR